MNYAKGILGYIRDYKFNSILLKNFLLITVLLAMPLAGLSILVYQYSNTIMKEEIERANLNALSRVRDSVDMIMGETERLSLRIASDPDVEAFIKHPGPNIVDYNGIQRAHKIQQILQITDITTQFIDSIYVYSDVNNYLVSKSEGGDLKKYFYQWWYTEYSGKKEELNTWYSRLERKDPLSGGRSYHCITSFRLCPLYGERKYGTVMINISVEKLGNLIDNVEEGQNQDLYIIDGRGYIIYNKDMAKANKKVGETSVLLEELLDKGINTYSSDSGDKKNMISIVDSKYNDWKYISVVPFRSFNVQEARLQSFMKLLVFVCILACVGLAFVISIQGFQPIRRIIAILESGESIIYGDDKYAKGKLNEIKYIAAGIINSFTKSREMEDELQNRYRMLKKAQSIALQSQISPHFLNNSLEAINWKVIRLTNSKNEASDMITKLSKLLRLSLDSEENLVPISKEIEHASLYIEMQKLRYKEKINVAWKIADHILHYKTMKLSLQPIIENAIYHGIKPCDYDGLITITGYSREESVVIEIEDNGVGMPNREVEKLNMELYEERIKENQHIGLRNVNQRIRIIFGEPYGLKVYSEELKGCKVVITIPKVE